MKLMTHSNDPIKEEELLHKKVPPRCVARFAAVQVLFQSFYMHTPIILTMNSFIEDRFEGEFYSVFQDDLYKIDVDFFKLLLETIHKNMDDIRSQLSPLLIQARNLEELELSTQSILIAGGAELCFLRDEVPDLVILDQYTLLAHAFLLKKGYALINGVLNALNNSLLASSSQ